MDDVQLGDSIAVNGVCLTVIKIEGNSFTVDVSRETLNCTVGLEQQGAHVNLEKALRLADRLGGHLVSGHVDGVGEVLEFTNLGESWKLAVRAPRALAKYIATKGSITINGVSLTVNQVEGSGVQREPDSAHAGADHAEGIAGGCEGESGNRSDRALCGTDDGGGARLTRA